MSQVIILRNFGSNIPINIKLEKKQEANFLKLASCF